MGQVKDFQHTTLETLQWFIFLLASSIALPIVIGSIYEMSLHEVSGLMQRTFFIVGIACFLQGLIGHKLPVVDGPAGIWISTFTVYAATAVESGRGLEETLRVLQTAMILTGFFLVIFGVFHLSQKMLSIFTPLVTGAFLFMLTIQLSGTFLQGMMGIGDDGSTAQLDATLISFFVFFFVLLFSVLGKGPLKSYAILIGIGLGWGIYALVNGQESIEQSLPALHVPEVFAWGLPVWDISVIPIAFITAIILLSNIVASLGAANQTMKGTNSFTAEEMNKGSYTLGINQGLSALFSSVAVVTLASSSGFMELTGQRRKNPFMYAAILLIIIAFFPPIVSFLSKIPSPVANAALLATFVQLMGIGLWNIVSEKLNQRKLTILGITFLVGIGLMFIPASAFDGLPGFAQNLVSNGLLMGTVIIILMEQFWKEKE
ncbi:Xanthine/uracil permease [Salinibacillus kushneri]|uniref:Xanthine/uracil permease n=1 Tax=Salinibacillus kushneri TaxID=237682 RepID=A0A1I0C4I1_9BACI|nr:purine/pyrimidine permease [Salinibacillus kushneri]SET13661.1 Xanthine/uracil permease [Salinibacillus kushneri]